MGAWDDLDIPENDGPNYWNPDEPETVEGKVLELGRFEDQEGKVHPQVTLEVDGEELVVTAFRTVLKQELNGIEDLKVGDTIRITFKGKAPGKRYFVYEAKKLSEAAKRSKKNDGDDF